MKRFPKHYWITVEDIPQPSIEPYATGDRVEIYVGPDDEDARFHGTVCEVVGVNKHDLDTETGRRTDAYSYTLRTSTLMTFYRFRFGTTT